MLHFVQHDNELRCIHFEMLHFVQHDNELRCIRFEMLHFVQHDNDIQCIPIGCDVMLNEVKHLAAVAMRAEEAYTATPP